MTGLDWETALNAVISRLDAATKAMAATVEIIKDLQCVLVEQAVTIRDLMEYRDELEATVERLNGMPANPAIDGLCRNCVFWDGDPDGVGVYTCRVSGSFTCRPATMRTEADFGCVHYSRGVAS